MDDISFGDLETLVASDVAYINTNGGIIGLNLNFIKCEQINQSNALTFEPIGQLPRCTINNATLIGALFVPGPVMDSALGKKLDDLKEHLNVCSSFQLTMRSYTFVLRAAHQIKLTHVMRSSSCAGHTLLSDIDNSLRFT